MPGRKVIETTCNDLYNALTALSNEKTGLSTLPTVRVVDHDALVKRLSQQLGSLILDPFKNLLAQKRLLIVSDGALQYIPFEVLLSSANGNHDAERMLIENHEIVYLPSASVSANNKPSLLIVRRRPRRSRSSQIQFLITPTIA